MRFRSDACRCYGLVFGCPGLPESTLHSVHAAAFVYRVARVFWQRSLRPMAGTAARAAVPQPKRGLLTPFSLEKASGRLVPSPPAHGSRRPGPRAQSLRAGRRPLSAGHGRLTRGAATAHPLQEPAEGYARPARAWHIPQVVCDTSAGRPRTYRSPARRPLALACWWCWNSPTRYDATPTLSPRHPLYIAVVGAPLSRRAGRRATS